MSLDADTLRAARKSRTQVLSLLAETSDWESALALLAAGEASEGSPCHLFDTINCNGVVTACERASQWQRSLTLLHEYMPRHAIAPDAVTYNATISACSRAWSPQRSLRLLGQMRHKGISATVSGYGAAITACARDAQWSVACRLLRGMRGRHVRPSNIAYNATMTACARGRQWVHALNTMLEMYTFCVVATTITYGTVIDACARGAAWEHAVALLEAGLLLFNTAHQNGSRVSISKQPRLSIMAFNAAIVACEAVAKWTVALRLLGRADDARTCLDSAAFCASISACEKGRRWQHAMALLAETRRYSLIPSVWAYNSAISSCARKAKWQQALSVFLAIPSLKMLPDVLSICALLGACELGGSAATHSFALKTLCGGASQWSKQTNGAGFHSARSVDSMFPLFASTAEQVVRLTDVLCGHRDSQAAFSQAVRSRILEPSLNEVRRFARSPKERLSMELSSLTTLGRTNARRALDILTPPVVAIIDMLPIKNFIAQNVARHIAHFEARASASKPLPFEPDASRIICFLSCTLYGSSTRKVGRESSRKKPWTHLCRGMYFSCRERPPQWKIINAI